MIKSLNTNLNIENSTELEKRLAAELEERVELSCWTYCGTDCLNYK